MQQQSPTINLALPIEAVQLIQAGLEQLPLGRSFGLYNHINAETQRQLKEIQNAGNTKASPEVKDCTV